MNKKANVHIIILFFLFLLVALFVGFLLVVGSSVINWVFDIAVPEFSGLGQVGSANMTEITSYTLVPLNNFVQSMTWLVGVVYVIMLVGCIGIAIAYRTTPSKWLIGLFLMLTILLVVVCIFMSNIYEEFYSDTGDLGTRLKEHTLLSFMILHSPVILTAVAFLTGIILFSGIQEEGGYA